MASKCFPLVESRYAGARGVVLWKAVAAPRSGAPAVGPVPHQQSGPPPLRGGWPALGEGPTQTDPPAVAARSSGPQPPTPRRAVP